MFWHSFLIIASQYSSENSINYSCTEGGQRFFFSKSLDILINWEFFRLEIRIIFIIWNGFFVHSSKGDNCFESYILKEYSIEYSSLFISSFNLKWNLSYSISVFLYCFSVFFLNSKTNPLSLYGITNKKRRIGSL